MASATRTKTELAPVPDEPVEAPKPDPLTNSKGEQLAFEGLSVSDRKVHIVGPITLDPKKLEALALGQVFALDVTVIVKSVSGKQKRDDWGDDKADVLWTLAVQDNG